MHISLFELYWYPHSKEVLFLSGTKSLGTAQSLFNLGVNERGWWLQLFFIWVKK
jgi:hypothetical protein